MVIRSKSITLCISTGNKCYYQLKHRNSQIKKEFKIKEKYNNNL